MTGYGLRYSGGFYDSDGNTITVEIHQKDYASLAESITLKADNPIVISKPSGDLLTHIFGTGCKINIVNNGSFLRYNNLFGTPEREHYVLVKKTVGAVVITLFEGFVLPQMYEQSLQTNALITVPANDQLSTLKNKKSTILTGDDNFIKLIDLVKEIVWSTDIHNPIYIKSGLYNTFYTAAFSTSITPFDEVYVDKNIFLEEPDVPKDNYYVLETILKTFGSRLYYLNGKWIIDRVKNHTDIDDYKVYNYNGTTSVAKYTRSTVELSDHYLINGSGNMSYEAGIQDYELTLRMNLFDNLVNTSFSGLKEDDNAETISLGGSSTDVITRPLRYEWVANNFGFMSTIIPYNDANIVDDGFEWYIKNGGTIPFYRSKVSTKLIVDFDKEASLNVRFNVSMIGIGINPTAIYNVRYSLRYRKETAAYKYKWIYENNGSLYTETDYVNNLDSCVFNHTMTGQEILDSSTPNAIQINKSIKIGDLMDEIKSDISPSGLLQFVELYFDVYLLATIPTPTYNPFRMRVGDFNISYNTKLEDNVIEAQIDSNYNSNINLELDLFDSETISIKNALLFYDSNGNLQSTSRYGWSEKGYTHKMKLHLYYLTDLIQNYNQNRYKLSLDVRLNGVNQLDLNNLYTYTHIIKNSVPVNMICMGYDYNVKQNTYSLELQEWTDDDGYYLVEQAELIDPATVDVSPTSFGIGVNGGGDIINVISNTKWYATADVDWIVFYLDEGYGNGIADFFATYMDDPNTPRTGVITITSEDGTATDTVTVYQSSVYDT